MRLAIHDYCKLWFYSITLLLFVVLFFFLSFQYWNITEVYVKVTTLYRITYLCSWSPSPRLTWKYTRWRYRKKTGNTLGWETFTGNITTGVHYFLGTTAYTFRLDFLYGTLTLVFCRTCEVLVKFKNFDFFTCLCV